MAYRSVILFFYVAMHRVGHLSFKSGKTILLDQKKKVLVQLVEVKDKSNWS